MVKNAIEKKWKEDKVSVCVLCWEGHGCHFFSWMVENLNIFRLSKMESTYMIPVLLAPLKASW